MAFDERAAIDRFWEARRSGEHFPADWRDRLDFEQAYRVQLGVVALRVAAASGGSAGRWRRPRRRRGGTSVSPSRSSAALWRTGCGGPGTRTGATN